MTLNPLNGLILYKKGVETVYTKTALIRLREF